MSSNGANNGAKKVVYRAKKKDEAKYKAKKKKYTAKKK